MPSRLGIGAHSSFTPRSLRIRNLYPSLIAWDASRTESSTAAAQPIRPFGDPEQHPQGLAFKMWDRRSPRIFSQIGVGQNRLFDLDPSRRTPAISSIKFGLGPILVTRDMTRFFADRIDRRIGHLREELLEIFE